MRRSTFFKSTIIALAMTVTSTAQTRTEKVLHDFGPPPDGVNPSALVFDQAGNLYGATSLGGFCCGTVFELMPDGQGHWVEKVLHSFNGPEGGGPTGVTFDSAGNLYGMSNGSESYLGSLFKLTLNPDGDWTVQVLYDFHGDGYAPLAPLIIDGAGNLYGTTEGGGGDYPFGTVFELIPNRNTIGGAWTARVLHGFQNDGIDGVYPWTGSLVFDSAHNLYGTTLQGGSHYAGIVFELMPAADGTWTEKVLHSFNNNGSDGANPWAGLIFDAAGNLYGTTWIGGSSGVGIVFELIPTSDGNWTEQILHSFSGRDGAYPVANLVFGTDGNLYGTTSGGGLYGAGTVFELMPNSMGGWTDRVLYSFHDIDGANPYTPVVLDKAGNIYGTTYGGGASGNGTAFEVINNHVGGRPR